MCESTMRPNAVSPGGHLGLFQLSPIHSSRVGGDSTLFLDPEINTATAYAIWSEQGWRPWACRP